jgi:hypothetical protein
VIIGACFQTEASRLVPGFRRTIANLPTRESRRTGVIVNPAK